MTTKTEAAARYREVASLPAYPCGDGTRPYNYGLTIRQEFAQTAMAGLLAGEYRCATEEQATEVARHAVAHADALIAALEDSK